VIIRSFRGVVVTGGDAAFYALVRARLVAFRRTFALIDSHVGRRTTPHGDEFLITTHWPSWDQLRAWANDDLSKPWGFEELMPYLVSWEVEHFEELDIVDEAEPGPS
jgi:heme-degrading monooxygenase HmoA